MRREEARKLIVADLIRRHESPRIETKVIHVEDFRFRSNGWWDKANFHEDVKYSLAAKGIKIEYMYARPPFHCVDPLPEIEQRADFERSDAMRIEWERRADRAICAETKAYCESMAMHIAASMKIIPLAKVLDMRNIYYEEADRQAVYY